MSDDKKNIGTDFDEELAKLVQEKSRKRTKNNIYERFISRVESTEDDENISNTNKSKPLNTADKLPAFEPLSATELLLFEEDNSDQARVLEPVDIKTTNATFDFSNQNAVSQTSRPSTDAPRNKAVNDSALSKNDHTQTQCLDTSLDDQYVDNNEKKDFTDVDKADSVSIASGTLTDEALDTKGISPEPHSEEIAPSENTVTSSKKPIIVGMIFGSLLIAIIVLTLIFTGVLSTSTPDADRSLDNSTEATVATDTPAVDPDSTTANAENQPTVEPSSDDEPVPVVQQSNLEDDVQNIPNIPVSDEGEEEPASDVATSEAEAAITYEDFREESQTTLYRETND
ncbi:hypothetical protein ACTXGL_09450 [Psychrobacter sp. T6-6]|uniref:hypothetical protein n=1 Tax=Psychrobacter sp. T6-6 TaxID=3457452 RepID=UPI003FD21449